MVLFEEREFLNKQTGQMQNVYKIRRLDPTGYGMMNSECVFGQFVMQPRITQIPKHEGGFFNSVKAIVNWLNMDPDNTNVQLNQYGTVNFDLPDRLAPILQAQDWTSRYFMIYLKDIGGGKQCWDMLETDAQGQPLPKQPYVVRNAPQNVPNTNVQQSANMQGYNRPAQAIGQYAQKFNNTSQMNTNVATSSNPQPPARPVTPPTIGNVGYQGPAGARQPQGQVYQPQPMPQPPARNNAAPVEINRKVAPPQANNVYPQRIQNSTGTMPERSVLPPLPQTHTSLAQGNNNTTVPADVPPPQQKYNNTYEKHGLTAQDDEIVQSLLCEPQYKDWKEAANRNIEEFDNACYVIAQQKQMAYDGGRLQQMYEYYKSL